MNRKEFDDLLCSIGTPNQHAMDRFDILSAYDELSAEIEHLKKREHHNCATILHLRDYVKKANAELKELHSLAERQAEIERLQFELKSANKDAAFLFNVMQRAIREDGCDIGIMLEDAALARKQHLDRVGDFNESEE